MSDAKHFLYLGRNAILITICAVISAQAQQRDPNQPRPTPTPTTIPRVPGDVITRKPNGTRLLNLTGVYGTIRWKKVLGLPFDSSRVRPPFPICDVFRVLLTTQEPGSPGTFGQARTAYYGASGKLTEDTRDYVCSYEITRLNGVSLPHNQTMVISADLDSGVLRGQENKPWSVGSDASPPPGQQRAIIIIGGRTNNGITLTDNQPRATVDFEMVYRPSPAPPR
jgi:hypothetical protein